jgi:TonB family protein
MPSMPQKIRKGFVELRTPAGYAYVSPPFWERIYLVWTFRNFRSLPKQVLNRRQQQLIDKLCRGAIVSRNRLKVRASMIGTVENMQPLPDSKTGAATSTSKLVEMGIASPEVGVTRAVGYEGISIRSNRVAHNQIGVRRFSHRPNVQSISQSKEYSSEQSKAKQASLESVDSGTRKTHRNSLTWALSIAFVVVLFGAFFYFREVHLAVAVKVAEAAIEAQLPASGGVSSIGAEQPEKVKQQMSTVISHRPTITTVKSPFSAVSATRHESNKSNVAILSKPPVENIDTFPARRLQLAEAPESGFRYPVAPSPNLTGKVSLKAIIDTNGTVKDVDVISGNRALADAAVRVVRQWRYHPYKLGGNAVEAETNIVISFVGADVVSISFPAAH